MEAVQRLEISGRGPQRAAAPDAAPVQRGELSGDVAEGPRHNKGEAAALLREHPEAVENLDRHFEQLKSAARQRLGSLYNEADYRMAAMRGEARLWNPQEQ